ncbi:MAG: hypothetical protein KatS3mg076_0774 [Candidatus Binatia bacterium]|nr:MAG: hypothetical protein KatS3mg076_0774 [Candidatus Binatia bacterium]
MLLNDIVLLEYKKSLRPEERLLLAVFEAAYWDLGSRHPNDQRRARNYFLSDDDSHTFSFVSVCQHFGWSVDSIRKKLAPLLVGPSPSEGAVEHDD